MVKEKIYNPRKEKALKIIKNTVIYIIMIFFAVIMLFPFYWSIITAIRPWEEVLQVPVSFIPHGFSFQSFKNFFSLMDNFGSALGYTILITIVGMFTNLFFGGLAGYTFARLQFRGRKIIFRIMLMSLMLPTIVTILPQYYIIAKMGLVGNWLAVVLPGAVGVYGIFFMRQFFYGVPAALGEAARIDGAGEFRIFWQIYFPQVTSGLITLGIITFNSYWNSYLWPSMVLLTGDVKMLSLLLGDFQQLYGALPDSVGSVMAGAIIIMLPSLIIFAFLQKYFLNTVTFAGVKE